MCAAGLLIAMELVALARQAQPVTAVSDTAVIETTRRTPAAARSSSVPIRVTDGITQVLSISICWHPSTASGSLTTGLNAGALAINLVSALVLAWVVVRAGGGVLAIVTMVMVALYAWRVAPILASPWTPHVIVLPTMALIVVSAAIVSGGPGCRRWSPGWRRCRSDARRGTALRAGGLGDRLQRGAGRGVRRRRSGRAASPGPILGVTLGVLAVLWSLPIREQFRQAWERHEALAFFAGPTA